MKIDNEKLVESYEKLQSVRKVGEALGISHETARVKLKKLGALNALVRYYANEDFFAQDTPESFYWAGFIAADGCVKMHGNSYLVYIGLARKDHDHLEKFKAAINFDGPVSKINSEYPSSQITITSKKLFDALKRFNIEPRKSLIYTFPKWVLKHEHLNHFIRGYFDGDGSFYEGTLYSGRTVPQLYFAVRGTKEFLTQCKLILEQKCEQQPSDSKPRLSSGIYMLEYGGTRAVGRIRDYLYQGSTKATRLDRKYNLAYDDKFVDLPEDYKFSAVIATDLETEEQSYFKSIKDAASVGFVGPGITACCQGKSEFSKGYSWRYAKESDNILDYNEASALPKDDYNKKWSDEDIQYLKSNYADVSVSKIAKALNRGYGAVTNKAKKMGLKRNVIPHNIAKIIAKSIDGTSSIIFASIKAAKQNGYPTVNRALKSNKAYKGYIWRYTQ